MDYTIKHITTEQELANALVFAREIFKDNSGFANHDKSRKEYLKNMERNNDLLLYAESNGEVVGIVFGSVGEGDDGSYFGKHYNMA